MRNNNLRTLITTSLYAALIYISISFLRIPVGPQMVHVGNALVVVGVLLFGSIQGAIAASLGLFIFDVLSGYASVAWITVLESLVVCLWLHVFFEKILKRDDSLKNVFLAGLTAAILKVIINIIKYSIYNVLASMTFGNAIIAAVGQVFGSYGTAIVTVIAVPIQYPILKEIVKRVK